MKVWVRFMDLPLRKKMAALLCVTSLLPLFLTAYVDIRDTRRRELESEIALLAARADHLRDELDMFNRGYRRAVDRISHFPAVMAACQSQSPPDNPHRMDAVSLLDTFPTRDKNIRGVALLNLSGTVTCATEKQLVGTNLSYRKDVRNALKGALVISDIYLAESQADYTPTIAYLAPLVGPGEKQCGLVALWVRASALWNIARASNGLAGPGSFAVLFDHHGIRMAHTYSDDIVFHPGGRLDDATVKELVSEHRFGDRTKQLLEEVRAFPQQFDRSRSPFPDQTMFRGFAPVNYKWNYGVGRRFETVPWTIFYMVPEESVNAPIALMTRQKIVFTSAVILFVLVAGVLFATSIVNPVRLLSRATTAIAGGDLTVRVPAERRDELGLLGKSFNAMVQRVELQAAALQKEHDDLEIRVRERTVELADAYQALQAERGRLRATLASIGDAVIATDTQGQITFANTVAEIMTGWKQDECIGENISDVFVIVDERTLQTVESPIAKVLEEGNVVRASENSLLVSLNGTKAPIESTGAAIRDDFGNLVGTILVFRDISMRKQAEAALKENEEMFRATFEQAAVGIAHVGLDGDWLRVNKKLCEIVAYDRVELLGRTFQDITHPDDLNADLAFVQQMLSGDIATYSMIKRYFRKDMSIVWIYLTVSLVRHASGEPKYFIAVVEDITERKRLENQLLEAQKLESIGRLAGGVAHDFNNLLTVILGYAELAGSESNSHATTSECLQQIIHAGEKAAGLTRQLLAFARRQVIAPKILNLNDLVLGLDKILRRLIGEDIELVVLLEENLHSVKVDPGQFEQILVNLVVNARDAMFDGGKITLETQNIILDTEYAKQHDGVVPGEYVMLAVSDTGAGMEEAVRLHIFEPFFTTKEKGRGTGLGLATVYGIVKQAGGHIWLYSEKGEGTTFKIYLPRHIGAFQSTQPAVAPASRISGVETILLVEDEPSVRMLAARTLRNNGYTVLEAMHGEEALRIAQGRETEITLLITDVVMPQMSGKELAERLQALHPELVVLYASGYTENTIVHHGVLDAGIAFLSKPFTSTGLLTKVREVLDQEDTHPNVAST